MPIYEVGIETITVVEAPDKATAENVARRHIGDIVSDDEVDIYVRRTITALPQLTPEWTADCRAYGSEKQLGEILPPAVMP